MEEILDKLASLDEKLFFAINDLTNPVTDPVMFLVSEKMVWVPFYLAIAFFLFWKFGKKAWVILALIGLSVIASDFFTSGIMKPAFERFRPCHDPEIGHQVNIVHGCGGQYGFASSHAANTFALATFLFLLLRRYYWGIFSIFLWSGLISFSRIYLGVHYPGDVVVGAMVGVFFAILFYLVLNVVIQNSWLGFSKKDSKKKRPDKRSAAAKKATGKRPPGRPRKVPATNR